LIKNKLRRIPNVRKWIGFCVYKGCNFSLFEHTICNAELLTVNQMQSRGVYQKKMDDVDGKEDEVKDKKNNQ
jgi:hypothetical protein